MSAAHALKAAQDAGIGLHVDGDDLVLEAATPPPVFLLDLLSNHKAGVIALLRQDGDGWRADDWLAFFDERAGIAEFDGALPRAEAEIHAFAACVVEWLNRDPVHSPPGRCLHCGEPERTHDPVLPFGTETTGLAWLHRRCWEKWCEGRRALAVAALAAMGIEERRKA